ncbi:MAG: glycoside hydrolase family 3 C-terminal domain-containing protein [Clostridiales bacterium]|nr:glycoside hydrolase family 3 C-terminal domain-containing protein [Clostridiales bacterium]
MKLRKRGYVGVLTASVSEREVKNAVLARRAAAEGFVLLKNEDHLLPLKKGSKIGLYGAGAVKTIKGGTGSGDVNNRQSVSIREGLTGCGFQITEPSRKWMDAYEICYDQAREDWKKEIFRKVEEEYDGNFFAGYSATAFTVPCGDPIDEAAAQADGADTAIFVLSRIAGENADRKDIPGDYYVTEEEKALIGQICGCYKKVILVVNTGGLLDLAFTDEMNNIAAIIQFMQAGQEGGNALADVLSGDVTPSGKMTDTWALDYSDYPNALTFSFKSGDVYKEEYKEGIYVGYRYFDTFDVPVRYCFGYGLSYTEFQIEPGKISLHGIGSEQPAVQVELSVKNTGDTYAGKEVAQIYVSCPQGVLPKEYRRLAAFAKTDLLQPGEVQQMKVSFPLYQMASYYEAEAAWMLEGGTYGIWAGHSLDSAKLIGTISLDETACLVQCENICTPKETIDEMLPDAEKMRAKEAAWLAEAAARNLPGVKVAAADLKTDEILYSEPEEHYPGKAGEIVESLSIDQLVALATGDPARGQGESAALGSAGQTVPGAAAETVTAAAADPWNVASIVLADGPAGLRLCQDYEVREDGSVYSGDFLNNIENGFFAEPREAQGTVYHQYCTAIPVGTLLAQTWDPGLLREVGEMIAGEMNEFEVSLWLAPGMNIHRNPLCGRNFEYFSEDPLVSGIMASAMTLGVQKVPGCGTTIKHFCCNNQEDNRMGSDSVLSERTLREIYLKGFEIAVKNAQPMSIMTSYNMVNGVHAANCCDICTKAARDEWGFAGAIMTDWTTTTFSTAGECSAAGCMKAGNDMVMPGDQSDHESIRQALADKTLDIRELKRCIYHTVRLILQTNQYEDAVSYTEQFAAMDSWLTVEK